MNSDRFDADRRPPHPIQYLDFIFRHRCGFDFRLAMGSGRRQIKLVKRFWLENDNTTWHLTIEIYQLFGCCPIHLTRSSPLVLPAPPAISVASHTHTHTHPTGPIRWLRIWNKPSWISLAGQQRPCYNIYYYNSRHFPQFNPSGICCISDSNSFN